ncbi:DUF4238 domain-containing protein [Mucilaginibacter polytrichastri]|uniref:DUF4238 domain-containing protein n=1 Tax=Mucilaginibacter polytrichastri TaxID=1302689 RepID=A0A1Q6A271_9SPHI|nr:DUF4238 domain-containing protein [Mucilaginibacter polytrichastri]OKS88098.1 hypothetical protein RG47T_3562 [Mucilaginibacter polytrichastri]SFT09758.1 Protein of unknown function [Mucilaginibacter polytrichastri]
MDSPPPSSKPKRHHYVPRCYLNNFLSKDHLYILDIRKVQEGLKERPKESHPNKICIDENFYSIKSEHRGTNFQLDQYDELFVESTVLHELENRYTQIFMALTRSEPLKMADAIYLCDFIIQMKIRNPFWLTEVISKNKDKWIDDSIAQIIKEKGNDNPHFKRLPEEFRQFVIESVRADQKGNKTFAKQMQLFGLIQRSGFDNERNEKYRNAIINCKWQLLKTPLGGPLLITSDNPGFAKSLIGLIHNSYFKDDSAFYFPLSPHYCLLINGFEKDNAYTIKVAEKRIDLGMLTSEQVIQINDHTIQRINRLLIAQDTWYIKQISDLNNPKK